jgi:YlmC/YmxH family sporulation protein
MKCRIADLRCKEVINICDGCRLGFVDDVIVEVVDGRLLAIVVPGPCRFLGLFGREDDYVIGWDCITRIGDDIILVDVKEHKREKKSKRFWF